MYRDRMRRRTSWQASGPAVGWAPVVDRAIRKADIAADDVPQAVPGGLIDLVILAVLARAVRCRLLDSDRVVTLRTAATWRLVPGEVVTVRVRKSWTYGKHRHVSGNIERTRFDAQALGLVPLKLSAAGIWDPESHWAPGDDIDESVRPFVRQGRPEFEMEQVLPGSDPDDPDSDPIIDAVELHHAGGTVEAKRILMDALAADLRCLDAHAHLGNFAFDLSADLAMRHYEVGLRIGELSLPANFDGVLPWGLIDNRPFFRCLHGYGLCLWRLGRTEEAIGTFTRQLSLNPPDNQGARFVIGNLRAGRSWEEFERREV